MQRGIPIDLAFGDVRPGHRIRTWVRNPIIAGGPYYRQINIDPEVNLATQAQGVGSSPWILPTPE